MTAITMKKVEELRQKLKAAPKVSPEKIEVTKTEAIGLLKGDIEAMQKRGYSLEAIAKFITDDGIEITTPTLKSYLQRAKKSTKTRSQKAAKPKQEGTQKPEKEEPNVKGNSADFSDYNPVPNKEDLI